MTTSQRPDAAAPVLLTTTDGVATITLNRPNSMNSLDLATKEALLSAVRRVAVDESVRCVVLTGTGRAFCVGQDLREHHEGLLSDSPVALSETVTEHYNPTVLALATMDKPVIAALNGIAAGAGASLAFAADFRILSTKAGYNLAFAGIALSCDTGASWTLPRLVGRAKALELLYFPATIDAASALELGLATKVTEPEDLAGTVHELAVRLATGPTLSYGAIRRSIEHASGRGLSQALEFEATQMARTGASLDHRNAVDSFLAKQQPTFTGR